MFRKIGRGLIVAVAVVVAVLVLLLAWAHLSVRREHAPLPTRQEVVASAAGAGHPVRLSIANTASQPMPRAAVLDPRRDPSPGDPYVMSHPSFVLEWPDGRILLVDAGMDREGALRFGAPIELVSGGSPIEPHASAADQLGPAATRVEGVVFTHLHQDHVGGITALCRGRTTPLRVFMTDAQEHRPNYTTRPGRSLLASVKRGAQGAEDPACVEIVAIGSGGLVPVPGFPGTFVIAAGGHTPGSQIVVASVDGAGGPTTYAFTGDIVNHVAGVDHDVPKPFLYRLVVVPEAEGRQGELRRFLRDLRDEGGVRLLVSHDQRQLEASGVAPYRAASSPISPNSSSAFGAGSVPPLNSR
jgi:glyoxylase-like metal-dependent hydrolase (beta-lactamase superfamily II)